MPAETASGTVWEAGRLDGARGRKSVLFGRTYEDPEIERAVFPAGGRVLCIASSGCTARSLSGRHEVVAVDINPVQLDYARRRLAGAPVEVGKAERVMAALRTLLPVVGIRRGALEDFLALDDPHEQSLRWRRLCTARFRLGLRIALSFTALRAVYASPLLELLPPAFGRVLLGRFERGFASHPNRTNPYARALFLGGGAGDASPAPGPVELICSDAAAYLEAQPSAGFDAVSLSNILDGPSPAYRQRLLAAVRHAARPGAPVVLRSFGEPVARDDAEAAAHDRAMLWGSIRIREAGALG